MKLPPPRWLAVFTPYLAVWLGLYVFSNAWVALVGYHIGIVFVLTLTKNWHHARALVRPANWKWLAACGLVGLSAGINLYWLFPLASVIPDYPAQVRALGLDSVAWIPFILYFSLVNPWLEEVFWRGWFGHSARLPRWRDALFAGYHLLILVRFVSLPWVLFGFVVLASASWFWRQATRETGSLLPAVLSHMAADASILVVVAWYALR